VVLAAITFPPFQSKKKCDSHHDKQREKEIHGKTKTERFLTSFARAISMAGDGSKL
jgi:hypothetical protein